MHKQDPLWKKTYVTFGDSFTNISLINYVDKFGLKGPESDAYDRKLKHYKTYPTYIVNRHEMNWLECAASGSKTYSPYWPEYRDTLTYLTKQISSATIMSKVASADYLTFALGINDDILSTDEQDVPVLTG